MSEHKEGTLKGKSFQFSIKCVNTYKFLTEAKKEFILSKQLLRSGTSVGANIREAQNAESKMDFIHKLGIAQKECDETLYWLELLYTTHYISDEVFKSLSKDASELLRILKSAILTSKKSLKK